MVWSHRATQLSIGADRSGLHRRTRGRSIARLRRTDEACCSGADHNKGWIAIFRSDRCRAGSEIFREVAGNPMPRFELSSWCFEGTSSAANGHRVRNRQPGRGDRRARGISKDRRPRRRRRGLHRRRGQKRARVWVQRPLVQRRSARARRSPRGTSPPRRLRCDGQRRGRD